MTVLEEVEALRKQIEGLGLSPGPKVGADHEPVTPSRTTLGTKKQKSKRAVSQESKVSSIDSGNDYEESKEKVTEPKPKGKKKKKGGASGASAAAQ